jgi:hypothetical protein
MHIPVSEPNVPAERRQRSVMPAPVIGISDPRNATRDVSMVCGAEAIGCSFCSTGLGPIAVNEFLPNPTNVPQGIPEELCGSRVTRSLE